MTEQEGVIREYDACHYIIKADQGLSNSSQRQFVGNLTVSVEESQAMNVYLYEGPNRLEALTPVIEKNQKVQASDSKQYRVPLHSSFLLIAYPEANIDST